MHHQLVVVFLMESNVCIQSTKIFLNWKKNNEQIMRIYSDVSNITWMTRVWETRVSWGEEESRWQKKRKQHLPSWLTGLHGVPAPSFQHSCLMGEALPAMQETWVWSLDWEDPLEKGMATHSSILAWRIPWTEERGGLQSMGSRKSWTWLSDSTTNLTGKSTWVAHQRP